MGRVVYVICYCQLIVTFKVLKVITVFDLFQREKTPLSLLMCFFIVFGRCTTPPFGSWLWFKISTAWPVTRSVVQILVDGRNNQRPEAFMAGSWFVVRGSCFVHVILPGFVFNICSGYKKWKVQDVGTSRGVLAAMMTLLILLRSLWAGHVTTGRSKGKLVLS
nr:hypothetical protein Iba_chr03fCG1430 [Ipomoea batatas]